MKFTAQHLTVFVLCILFFPDASTMVQDTLNDPVHSFSFEFDGRILIPVTLMGDKELDLILDSGFPQENLLLLMHKELGDELELKYVQSINAARGAGSGEAKLVHLAMDVEASVSHINLNEMIIGVMDESVKTSSHHNKGVLGGALFIPYVVKIDFDNNIIDLYAPGSFRPDDEWEEISLILSERKLPLIETSFSFGSSQYVKGRFIIDTGAKGSLILVLDEKNNIDYSGKTINIIAGTGLRGDVFTDMGRVAELKFGKYSMKNVIAALVSEEEISITMPALSDIGCHGLIGIDAMSRFNLIFDYPRKKLFIRPNKNFNTPFELNMAGMVIRENTIGEYYVYHVINDEEANKKGLIQGDIIGKINGKPISNLTYGEVKRSFEQNGQSVKLEICRNGETKKFRLKLKRII